MDIAGCPTIRSRAGGEIQIQSPPGPWGGGCPAPCARVGQGRRRVCLSGPVPVPTSRVGTRGDGKSAPAGTGTGTAFGTHRRRGRGGHPRALHQRPRRRLLMRVAHRERHGSPGWVGADVRRWHHASTVRGHRPGGPRPGGIGIHRSPACCHPWDAAEAVRARAAAKKRRLVRPRHPKGGEKTKDDESYKKHGSAGTGGKSWIMVSS